MQEVGFARLIRTLGMTAGVVSLFTAAGFTTADAADPGPLGPGAITYDVSPNQAGLNEFQVVAVPGQVVNGVCEHAMPMKALAGGEPLIVQQVAYNPATCTDLVREGRGPGSRVASSSSV